ETVTYESEISIIDEQTVVRLTFNTGASVSAGRQLLDGEYQLLIDDSKAGSFGSPLDGDGDGTAGGDYIFGASPADDFFRKYGDENGDRSVNLLDFAGFRTDFGTTDASPNFDRTFDANEDGQIDLLDFAEFRTAFGQ
ncbi:MAG: dockerin type I domain-containing protein, partial [Planctomycetota bacterium]